MFKRLTGAKDALAALLRDCNPIRQSEELSLNNLVGRVLSRDLYSDRDLPAFNRAAMDGFAVNSSDTRSAKPYSPVYLDHFLPIRTGMYVPEMFDAIIMLEDALLRGNQLELIAEVYPFKNIAKVGEDISHGQIVMKDGHRLRPPDIALLAALGICKAEVYCRPKVAILPTGEELVPIGSRALQPGEAYEINGLMTQQYVEMWGGEPILCNPIADDLEKIRGAIESHLNMDMIIAIGGTSIGEKDYVPQILSGLGNLLVHGIRIQPGKPTAIGTICAKPVICLPGYPVATLSSLYLFVRSALKKMSRLNDDTKIVSARLTRKVISKPGYISIARVSLDGDKADPIMVSGAGILSSVARADGFIAIPEDKEGLDAGQMVEVQLFE
jgi:molybdopterin molybdotransferase